MWIALAVVVAALFAALLYFVYSPDNRAHLGLAIVYRAESPTGQAPTQNQLRQTVGVIDRRIRDLGITRAAVRLRGADQIGIYLSGAKDIPLAMQAIAQPAQLQFFDDGKQRVAGPEDSLAATVEQARASPLVPLRPGARTELDKIAAGKASTEYLSVVARPGTYGANKAPLYFMYSLPTVMTGSAIAAASQGSNQNGSPNVLITFTSTGGKRFGQITRGLAVQGRLTGANQTFAIVLDNQMESDPYVDYKQNPNGIQGTSAEIDGNFTIQEARNLAAEIDSGALPVTLVRLTPAPEDASPSP
jgi:preprotein translocase subunit SecD